VWFNGVVRTFTVGVEEGENIIIPIDAVNENYTHELRLYASGALLNCFTLKTVIDTDAGSVQPIPPVTDGNVFIKVYEMGTFSGINTVYGTPVSIPNGSIIQD